MSCIGRVRVSACGVTVTVSAAETAEWGRRWPCATLRGRRVSAAFARGGLVDLTIDGHAAKDYVDGCEFDALMADVVAGWRHQIPDGHPCAALWEATA